MSRRKKARFADGVEQDNSEPQISQESASSLPQSQNIPLSQHMRAFREVAVRRAEHFARADAQDATSAASTTPTGRLRAVKLGKRKSDVQDNSSEPTDNEAAEEKEAWPGPWSTARDILAAREALKHQEGDKTDSKSLVADPDTADQYDRAIASLSWKPIHSDRLVNNIPRLSTLCIRVLSKYIEHLESYAFLPLEHLDQLADQLGREKKLDLSTCVRLAVTGSMSLYLPDCGAIDEDVLIQAVETVNGLRTVDVHKGEEVQISQEEGVRPIQRLVLRSCGRCFTDKVAAAIYNHIYALEEMVLSGCYRLSDDGLHKLLEGCASRLQVLDLSSNSRLGNVGMRAITQLQALTSLRLDHVGHLTNAHLLALINSSPDSKHTVGEKLLASLEEISLIGCHEVSDKSMVPFLATYGNQLTSFAISSYAIADETIVALRTHCHSLETLRLVNLAEVTAAALIGLFVVHPTAGGATTAYGGRRRNKDSLGPLRTVDLYGGVSVFDDAIIQLTQNYGGSLSSLCLHSCSRLTNRAAAAIWIHCRDLLRVLDVSFVRGFSETALGQILNDCVHLETLRIWGCTQVKETLLTGHQNLRLEIVGHYCVA